MAALTHNAVGALLVVLGSAAGSGDASQVDDVVGSTLDHGGTTGGTGTDQVESAAYEEQQR